MAPACPRLCNGNGRVATQAPLRHLSYKIAGIENRISGDLYDGTLFAVGCVFIIAYVISGSRISFFAFLALIVSEVFFEGLYDSSYLGMNRADTLLLACALTAYLLIVALGPRRRSQVIVVISMIYLNYWMCWL